MTKFHITISFEGEGSEEILNHLHGLHELREIPRQLDRLITAVNETKEILMATQADLTAAFDAIDTSINKFGDDLTKTLKDLTDAIAAGKTGPDLAPFVTRAQGIASKLSGFDTAVTTADAGVTPPVTP